MKASNASATLPTFVQKCRMPGLLWQLLCKSIECLSYFCYFCAKASNASATFAYFWPNVSNASATLSTCVQKRQMPQLLCTYVRKCRMPKLFYTHLKEIIECLNYFAHQGRNHQMFLLLYLFLVQGIAPLSLGTGVARSPVSKSLFSMAGYSTAKRDSWDSFKLKIILPVCFLLN